MSACPDANGTGIADATRTPRREGFWAKKNARHAQGTAGGV